MRTEEQRSKWYSAHAQRLSLATGRRNEVERLYGIGRHDPYIGKILGISRERVRQIRKKLGLPVLPPTRKPRNNCLVCGVPTRGPARKYCSLKCMGIAHSYAKTRYRCPICNESTHQEGGNRERGDKYYQYHRCRSGHWLRCLDDRLIPTRDELKRLPADPLTRLYNLC